VILPSLSDPGVPLWEMAIQGAVRARGARGSELRSLNGGGDLEDGKYHGDTLLFGLNINKRAALLLGAALLAVVLVAVSLPGEDDAGGMAEKRLGGAPRGEDLLSEEAMAREQQQQAGFARPTLPHSTKSKSAKAGSKSALSSHKSKTSTKKKVSSHKAPSSLASGAGGAPAPLDPSEMEESAMEKAGYPDEEEGLGVGGAAGSLKGAKKSGTGTATGSAKKAYKVAGKLKTALDDEDEEDEEDEDLDDEDSDLDEEDEDEDEDEDDEDEDDIVDHVDEEDERSDEELKRYANAMYDEMDKNKDDKVTWEEYYHVVRKDKDYTGETKAEEEEDFREIDANHDGLVTRQEFVDDWLRDDLEFADDDELDDEDEDEDDEDDDEEDEADADVDDEDEDEDRPLKKKASSSSSASKSKAAAPPKVAGGDDETLGDKLKETALKIFKTRAPTAKSINVKLFQAEGVSWGQSEQHCRKLGKRLCPERAVQQLKLCRDPDPSHKGRSVPIDAPGVWVTLETCTRESHGEDRAKKALIACC